jgi:hypothetical protein
MSHVSEKTVIVSTIENAENKTKTNSRNYLSVTVFPVQFI